MTDRYYRLGELTAFLCLLLNVKELVVWKDFSMYETTWDYVPQNCVVNIQQK